MKYGDSISVSCGEHRSWVGLGKERKPVIQNLSQTQERQKTERTCDVATVPTWHLRDVFIADYSTMKYQKSIGAIIADSHRYFLRSYYYYYYLFDFYSAFYKKFDQMTLKSRDPVVSSKKKYCHRTRKTERKRCFLSCERKDASTVEDLISSGRVFHSVGPSQEKARSP